MEYVKDHLFDRTLKAMQLQHRDMDNTTLGKLSLLAIPTQTGLSHRLTAPPPFPHQHAASSSKSLWTEHRAVKAAALGPPSNNREQTLGRRVFYALFSFLALAPSLPLIDSLVFSARSSHDFKRLGPLSFQYIAALSDPSAGSGTNAKDWGIWRVDPGPRGVQLEDAEDLITSRGSTLAGWKFDKDDWWLEEHGIIMEKPDFPLPAGLYSVTGGREANTVLTVEEDGGTLYDVTHLPCRAARYTGGSPSNARLSDFPVNPGAAMPTVKGSDKQDYAILFVTAIEK